jgi:serine/threonine protein kinase
VTDDVQRCTGDSTGSAADEHAGPTAAAPSYRAPTPDGASAPTAPLTVRAGAEDRPLSLLPGAQVSDFEIIRTIGRGAFGTVYLARQISLDRQVALKVSVNRGSEGRTMARLEHQHIVQVFSETVEADFNQRLLCMQLVPGVSLDRLIGALHAGHARRSDEPPAWTGTELLAVIDKAASLPTALDPSALHDREALSRMDAISATAWFGARLAEALDFAHHHGVLHRDIKPANILVNPYGQPMLADFNISSRPLGADASGEEIFGGTFAYMAPEHLDAFNSADPAGPEAVDARSDLYSLGLVLGQLFTGRLAFFLPPPGGNLAQSLREMAEERREAQAPCRPGLPGARQVLERTISRCLSPSPADRFASGAELADQLDGCRELRQAERLIKVPHARMRSGTGKAAGSRVSEVSPRDSATYLDALPIAESPVGWLIALVLLPQLIASAVNIIYNSVHIGEELTDSQRQLFVRLVIGYNALVYPLALVALVIALRPVWRCWLALRRAKPLENGRVTSARRQALRLPRWIAGLTALGWFPGGVLFPWLIHLWDGPIEPRLAGHFIASFWLSGLIALAYSLCGAELVVMRALYPALWLDVCRFHRKTGEELVSLPRQLAAIQLLAVSIPLVAAVLTLFLFADADWRFRLLVAGLIILGMFGAHVAGVVTRGLSQVVFALTSTRP